MSYSPEAKHAFAINPVGPVPYSGYQVFGIFLVGFSPIPALAACGLRVYSRRLSQGLGLDDWLIFLAAALGIPQAVFATLYIRAGYWGIHDADIPPHPWNQGLFWGYLNRVFYTPLLVLVKISALLFLLRLGGTKKSVRLACKALIAFCVAQVLAFLPPTMFMCQPVQFTWLGAGKGRCFHPGAFTVALASTNILTDILTLLIPFIAFLSLKLSDRIRYALLSVFTLGVLVTLTSVVRLYFIVRLWYFEVEDQHYSIGYTLNTVEVNLAIVTATIPALWPLGRRWFPAVFESMGINRPYLYPDIEVGYVPSSGGRDSRQAAEGGGAGPGAEGAAAAQGSSSGGGGSALQSKILWLQRPRPPSFLRCTSDGGGGGGGGGGSSVGLTDVRGQTVYGATLKRSTVGSGDDDEEEDGLFDDYHGMIRRTEMKFVREEDDASTVHKLPGSEATRSSTDIRG